MLIISSQKNVTPLTSVRSFCAPDAAEFRIEMLVFWQRHFSSSFTGLYSWPSTCLRLSPIQMNAIDSADKTISQVLDLPLRIHQASRRYLFENKSVAWSIHWALPSASTWINCSDSSRLHVHHAIVQWTSNDALFFLTRPRSFLVPAKDKETT